MLLLGAEEPFGIGGVAAVFAGRGEQVFFPDDAIGLGEIVAELGGAKGNTTFLERAGNSHQRISGSLFLGLCFFHTCACSSTVAAAMVRSWSSFGMLPWAITSSIGGCRWASSLRHRTLRSGSASASRWLVRSSLRCRAARSRARYRRSTSKPE